VLPGLAYHITQRGVDHCETFCSDLDRTTYLKLLGRNLEDSRTRLLAWCLMSNHVHLIAVAGREDSLAVLLRRVHGRYAQYHNAQTGRTGHLWQSRYFACALSQKHLWSALSYVEANPVRAGLVDRAEYYRWSSAGAHVSGADRTGLLDMDWWAHEGAGADWAEILNARGPDCREEIERCTYSGKPFGEDAFLTDMSERFGRHWKRGRPRKAVLRREQVLVAGAG
jgi:putative transposase